ncbi:HNH endonuclease [Streptomyces sp. NPDC005576]|uniref:HNH endonuclease n=1 Tax=Streptomyces sp. NPDC005576 TaxID=3364726 RepID=UPI0036A6BBC4
MTAPVVVATKACRGCGETKPLDDYARKGKSRAARCKDCLRKWAVQYRSENADRVRVNERTSRASNALHRQAWRLSNYQKNKEKIRARVRARYSELYPLEPERWLAANARRKQRLKVDMDKMDRALSLAYRRAIRVDACRYCSRRLVGDMHVDHFYPLAKGGTNHWWNLVQSCGPCNRHKHDRCGTWMLLRKRTS